VDGNQLRNISDKCTDKDANLVVVLCGVSDGKGTFACRVGKDALSKGKNAGKIVRAVAQLTGGNGGGKPDIAMAGAKDITKIDEALAAVQSIVSE
jgi:alanyl-tRNA synthetase